VRGEWCAVRGVRMDPGVRRDDELFFCSSVLLLFCSSALLFLVSGFWSSVFGF
jgi:hypothetical protein